MARQNRFTVYDMMDAKGMFDSNPANPCGKDSNGLSTYKGPVEYPKMMYHPTGEMRVIQEPEIIVTPMGPKAINGKSEMISQIVEDKPTEMRLLAEGWHLHPADAVEAGGGKPAVKSAMQLMKQQESKTEELVARSNARIKELEAQLAAMAGPPSKTK